MGALSSLTRFIQRFRYHFTLPEDVASSLGINISNFVTFDEFIQELTSPDFCPTKLTKFMPRTKAEAVFSTAQRKECFQRCSLFSYYFSEGWLEFILEFDQQSTLRRIYLQHKSIPQERGIEIKLRY